MTRRKEPVLSRRERRTLDRTERPIRERPRVAKPRRRPAWQSPFALVSVAAVLVVAAIIVLNQKASPSASGDGLVQPPTNWSASVTDGETAGRADAPVTLAVYADFQCPICGRFAREQLGNLKTQFIDTGLLRVESHDIAILGSGTRDELVELATGARCAADQGKYWAYHDLVYWNQQRENQGDYTAEFIRSIAIRAGADGATWDTCMSGTAARAAVRQDASAALQAGINSTPRLGFNGGTPVAGLPDAQSLIARIQSLASVAPASLIPASATPEVTASTAP